MKTATSGTTHRRAATERTQAVSDDLRYRLLRLLTAEPEISQRDLARRLGMSLGKTNYCVRALIDRGWVKMRNFRNSDNKLAYAYVLTPRGLHEKGTATSDFLRRKQHEFVQLEREIAELSAEVERPPAGGKS